MGAGAGPGQHGTAAGRGPARPWHAGHLQPFAETADPQPGPAQPPRRRPCAGLRRDPRLAVAARGSRPPVGGLRLSGHRQRRGDHHRLPRGPVGEHPRGVRTGRHRRGGVAELPWRHAIAERPRHEGPGDPHRSGQRHQPGSPRTGAGTVADQGHPGDPELQQPARLHHARVAQAGAAGPGPALRRGDHRGRCLRRPGLHLSAPAHHQVVRRRWPGAALRVVLQGPGAGPADRAGWYPGATPTACCT